MALPIAHVVIGARQPEACVRFLEAFGFEAVSSVTLDAACARALYGLDEATEEVRLGAGGGRGDVFVVATPHPPAAAGALVVGPHAVDLYTRDVERSRELAEQAGAVCGPIVDYSVGPLRIRECKVTGPDHLALVFIEVDRRRPSLLDRDTARLHSEVHSAVWVVQGVDAGLPFWCGHAGLSVLLDATFREPAVARLMELSSPTTPVRLVVLAGADAAPPRLELIECPEEAADPVPAWPIRPGLHAAVVEVPALEAVTGTLPGVDWGQAVQLAGGVEAVAGTAPCGVRLVVRGTGR
jgi:catechol 2,3-dioxygenase-like lactoylglutathione lyase family enzyme